MAHRLELRARASHRFLYAGRTLLVTNLDGMVTGQGTEGFYVENTRVLCRDELRVNGQALNSFAASTVRGDGFLSYLEVPRTIVEVAPADPMSPKPGIFIEVARILGEGMRTEITVTTYHPQATARFDLSLYLAADFADIDEAHTGTRQQQADVETTWDEAGQELCFRYMHPQLNRAAAIHVESAPTPPRWEGGALVVPIEARPRCPVVVCLTAEPVFDDQRRPAPSRVFGTPTIPLASLQSELREATPTLTTTNATVARAWRTATEDLASLLLGVEPGPAAPSAGIPLYQQIFGRDMITIGWQALLMGPRMLGDALRLVATHQGTTIDDWRDEEPGKLLHQARRGPLSELELNPFQRYYGDYATPPDFLIGLGQYLAWTNDRETVRTLLPAARQAIDWLDRYGDRDGDGFIEYVCRSARGVKNQGWKDSDEAIIDERGRIVPNPIATCELQAYWYAGLQQVGLAFLAAGDRAYGVELLSKARDLKRRFHPAFWLDAERFYAVGLGPDKQSIRSIASNPGHLLATGIVPRACGPRVAQRLMEPDLFSGWGIRTLSSTHPAYNPFSYHLGSVWPVDAGTFAFGFARYGCWEALHQLAAATFDLCQLFVSERLPESIGGLPREERHPHPGIYPASNEPQGWSASAIVLLVQALLGLRPVAPLRLLLIDPHLPTWLPDLRLEGIRVGQARVDLDLWRERDGETRWRAIVREGTLRVLRQPAPQGPRSSLGHRVATALRLPRPHD